MPSQVFNQIANNPEVQRAKGLYETGRRTGEWKDYFALKRRLKVEGISMPEFRHIVSGRDFAPPKSRR